MNRIIALALAAGLVCAPAVAASPSPETNWGQQVKATNQANAYPDGTNRGAYVRAQARDNEGPGYGYEIQTLAPIGNQPAPHKP